MAKSSKPELFSPDLDGLYKLNMSKDALPENSKTKVKFTSGQQSFQMFDVQGFEKCSRLACADYLPSRN